MGSSDSSRLTVASEGPADGQQESWKCDAPRLGDLHFGVQAHIPAW